MIKRKGNEWLCLRISIIIFLALGFLPTSALFADTYKFERMLPTLQQPWYFNLPESVAIDSNGFVYVADTFNYCIQKFTSDGQLVTRWGNQGSGNSQFNHPEGIAVDNKGFVYVADTDNHRIQKFTPDGQFLLKWGNMGSGNGQFNMPQKLVVDSSGYVYVGDFYNYRIQKFTSSGQFINSWGISGYGYGIAVDSSWNVYVSTAGGIQKFTSTGQFITSWGTSGAGDGQFNYATGIDVDGNGYVYVIDSGNNRIQKFTSGGQFVTKWVLGRGDGDGQINQPWDLAVDSSGVMYVADSFNNRIQKFTSSGQFIAKWASWGSGDGQFNGPWGITVDSSGFLYIADTLNNRIQKFTPDGQLVLKWGSTCDMSTLNDCVDPDGAGPLHSGDGQFNQPKGIAVDSSGYIYVADKNNDRIQKFTSGGQFVSKWGTLGLAPFGIAVDSSGNVFVSSYGSSVIEKYNSGGQFLTLWGGGGSGDGQFFMPQGVAVDNSGYVYVADTINSRIQKFSASGQFVAKWGSSGSGDGQFNLLSGVAVDSSGYVYVADEGNNRIQKFSSTGQFTAKFGGPGPGPGLFSGPGSLVVSNNKFYITDSGNNRVQVLKSAYVSSNNKAIVVAGGGPFAGNKLWEATETAANFAYMTLASQGFTNDRIYYLSSDTALDLDNDGTPNVEADATVANLQNAITTWASDADNLFVYLVDHGGSGTFRMSETATLSSSQLGSWLDTFQSRSCLPTDIFSESFENGLPSGWAVINNGSYGAVWRFDNPGSRSNLTGGSGKFAIADSDYAFTNYMDTELRMPVMDLSNMSTVTLEFKSDFYYYAGGGNEIADADVSVNGTAGPWTNIWRRSGTDYRGPKTETIDITTLAAGHNNVMVRFHYYNANFDWWWQVDDVKIRGRSNTCNQVTVIYDACESGSFLSALTPPSGKERILVSSTSTGQSSYFVNQGSVSFSNFFWTNVFNGSNVKVAFDNAKSALNTAITNQTPQLEDGTVDDSLAAATYIGNGTIIYGNVPTIGSVASPQNINGTATATLTAGNVTDSDGIARVWAVILPPNYASGASNNAVNGLPSVDLMPIPSTNNYTATYSSFNLAGTYNIAIYAKDSIGNTSMPTTTTVTVGNPIRKRAIIVAGGSQTDANWNGIQKGAQAAYDALKFQGYSDNDIYFTSPVTFISGIDGTSTLSNLNYAINTWSAGSTQDVVLYMVGNGDNGTFAINSTETLSAVQLDTWLDSLQNTITGNVTVVYDAGRSGSFVSSLTPPGGKQRIVLASTDSKNAAAFLSNGDISFSRYFWGWILNGINVRDSYLLAKSTMSSYQTAQLDDNGNGTANETSDGPLAFNYTIGVGIRLAGNAPIVGSVIPDQILSGTTSLLLYAENVTTTGTLDRVWAIITPPDYYPAFADEPLPELTLSSVGSNRYEGTYSGFTQFGMYKISIYAKDMDGNISAVKEITVQQQNAPDIYEDDDTYSQAREIFLNHAESQHHNFDNAGDSDWVMFYGQNGITYEVQATNLESNSDVVLELYDTNGTTQLWTYNGGGTEADEIKSWTCTVNGVYYIKVRHANSAIYGDNTGYDLDVLVPAMPTCSNGILSGKVKDASTLAAISGVKVKPADGNGIAIASDTSGNYRTTRFVCGTESVSIVTDPYTGYTTYTGSASFTADLTTTKNISMPRTNSLPVANFTGSPTSGTAPLTVNFTNTSTGNDTPLSYAWDLDNNGTTDSTALNPSAVYSAGTYTAKLTVTDSNGDANTLTNTSYISVCYSNANIVGSGSTYSSLQSAYNAAADTNTIQGRAVTLIENINFNRNITVTIQGGYNCDHSAVTGKTVITGAMTISNGKVTMENVQVQ